MFKVGDKVRVVYKEGMSNYNINRTVIEKADGKVYEVVRVINGGTIPAYVLKNVSYWWPEYMLQAAVDKEEIHITREGETVRAVYENGEEIRHAELKCNLEDTFEAGAGIAMKRLFAKNAEWTLSAFLEEKEQFVINCETEKEATLLMALLHQRQVRWYEGNRLQESLWARLKDEMCYCYEGDEEITYCSKGYVEEQLKIPVVKFANLDIIK